MDLCIKNGIIIKEDGLLEGHNLYIKDGKIQDISKEKRDANRLIDAKGLYVSPGFIDIHSHGGAGFDFMDTDPMNIARAARFHLEHGTTTIYPTTYTSSFLGVLDALKSIREAKKLIGNIEGAHMESRYFSLKQSGAQNPEYIVSPSKEETDILINEYGDILKRVSYAPELEGAASFETEMIKAGIILSAGHTDCTYEDMVRAYENGNKLVTHLYSCTSTITRDKGFRILGLVETAFLIDDIDVEIIADGKHLPPELIRMIYKIKGDNHICLVTDSLACTGTKEERSFIGEKECIIEDGVAKLPDRSAFAGSIASADRLIRVCVKEAKIPLYSALKMMSTTPARVMGLKNKGKIENGYDGDIVIFDADINIKTVILKGKERKTVKYE